MGIPPKDRARRATRWYIHNAGLTGGDKLPSDVCFPSASVSRARRFVRQSPNSSRCTCSRAGGGRAPYVLPPKPINIFQETRNFSDAVRRVGREPGARLLDARVVDADEVLAAKFDLAVGSRVFEVRRVRFADDVPVAVETSYINYALCPGIEGHDFSRESLYDVLAHEHGSHVGHGTERVSIARATSQEAESLLIDEGEPVFFVQALERTAAGVPMEYLKAVYVPSRYRFASNGCKNGEVPEGVSSTWLTW